MTVGLAAAHRITRDETWRRELTLDEHGDADVLCAECDRFGKWVASADAGFYALAWSGYDNTFRIGVPCDGGAWLNVPAPATNNVTTGGATT